MVAVQEVGSQKSMSSPPIYTVELVCVGNELLIGKIPNTNAQWLADRIVRLGGRVSRETTVPDNLDEISSSIRDALKRRPNLVITSGGLGPTHDDMTLRGVARAVGRRVKLNRTAIRLMKRHYRKLAPRMRIHLNKPRLKMACLPIGSEPIENPAGSAPAALIKYRQVTIISLPGVPKELKAIFNDSIVPLIRAKTRRASFFEESILTRAIVESELSPIIDKVMKQYSSVFIKSHPKGGKGLRGSRLELHFSSTSSNEQKTKEELLNAAAMLIRLLARSKKHMRRRKK